MKRLFILFTLLLSFVFVNTAFPQFLACDIPTDTQSIIESAVEVDGLVVKGLWKLSQDETSMLLFNLAELGPGQHVFKARIKDVSGWWSDWSDPLVAGKPAKLGSVKVVEK